MIGIVLDLSKIHEIKLQKTWPKAEIHEIKLHEYFMFYSILIILGIKPQAKVHIWC